MLIIYISSEQQTICHWSHWNLNLISKSLKSLLCTTMLCFNVYVPLHSSSSDLLICNYQIAFDKLIGSAREELEKKYTATLDMPPVLSHFDYKLVLLKFSSKLQKNRFETEPNRQFRFRFSTYPEPNWQFGFQFSQKGPKLDFGNTTTNSA